MHCCGFLRRCTLLVFHYYGRRPHVTVQRGQLYVHSEYYFYYTFCTSHVISLLCCGLIYMWWRQIITVSFSLSVDRLGDNIILVLFWFKQTLLFLFCHKITSHKSCLMDVLYYTFGQVRMGMHIEYTQV